MEEQPDKAPVAAGDVDKTTTSTSKQPQVLSPLTGCYLLVVVGEPHSDEHKDIILRRIAKGLLSWDVGNCHVDIEKELQTLVQQAPEAEDARHGERLIQYATESLVIEVLIHPATSTLAQCVRNLLSSFTRHRHFIHAGYTFAGNGAWILQDGTFSVIDFAEAFQENEVQRVLRAYENTITVDIHCSSEGDWARLPREPFAKFCKLRINPDDVLTSGSPAITDFLNYLSPHLVPADVDSLLQSSDIVGNIRFSHPTLYIFPGGQGDAALFGINGFNMLLDGGFARKACFWDFVRHLDRLDAVLLTRLNNSNVCGISSVLRRKKNSQVYPQIGHLFSNILEKKSLLSPDGDKDKDPLLINLFEEGQDIVSNLRHLSLKPQPCFRDIEPINLYHKVGHGTLDMYVLSPSKDSKELRDYIMKWTSNDAKLFTTRKDVREFNYPLPNLVSICALLVWQPANQNENITRILFPGSTPQHKIFEGLDKLRHLEFMKHPVCTAKILASATSLVGLKAKPFRSSNIFEKILSSEPKKYAPSLDNKTFKEKKMLQEEKANVDNKTLSHIENGHNQQITNGNSTKTIESVLNGSEETVQKDVAKTEPMESNKSEQKMSEIKKTELNGSDNVDSNIANEISKSKVRPKVEARPRIDTKTTAMRVKTETTLAKKPIEKKFKSETDKKPEIRASPKKIIENGKVNGAVKERESSRTRTALVSRVTKVSPTSTPAKSTKEANNRKVVESKVKSIVKKEAPIKAEVEKKEVPKPERKPISRRPKPTIPPAKTTGSPIKRPTQALRLDKDGNIRKMRMEKDGTTDSSTVSTPSADQEMKKIDISKLTKAEIESLKAKELAELKEEQEVVKEIEAVFRKDEQQVIEISVGKVEEPEEVEEYLIIEKEEVEHFTDSANEPDSGNKDEDEIQKLVRDSQESEKLSKLKEDEIQENKEVTPAKPDEDAAETSPKLVDQKEPELIAKDSSMVSSEEKLDLSSEKKDAKDLADDEIKEQNVALESQPDEKVSTTVESGATTAPTLPEDERIPLDEIKEDPADQVVEEKYVKEETKEKELPPPENVEQAAEHPKHPSGLPVNFEEQKVHLRDVIKTPDEVADLPVDEVADGEAYTDFGKDFKKEDAKKTERDTPEKDTEEKPDIIEAVPNEIKDSPEDIKLPVEEARETIELVKETVETNKETAKEVQETVEVVKETTEKVKETVEDVKLPIEHAKEPEEGIKKSLNDLNDSADEAKVSVKEVEKLIEDDKKSVEDFNEPVKNLKESVGELLDGAQEIAEETEVKNDDSKIELRVENLQIPSHPEVVTLTPDSGPESPVAADKPEEKVHEDTQIDEKPDIAPEEGKIPNVTEVEHSKSPIRDAEQLVEKAISEVKITSYKDLFDGLETLKEEEDEDKKALVKESKDSLKTLKDEPEDKIDVTPTNKIEVEDVKGSDKIAGQLKDKPSEAVEQKVNIHKDTIQDDDLKTKSVENIDQIISDKTEEAVAEDKPDLSSKTIESIADTPKADELQVKNIEKVDGEGKDVSNISPSVLSDTFEEKRTILDDTKKVVEEITKIDNAITMQDQKHLNKDLSHEDFPEKSDDSGEKLPLKDNISAPESDKKETEKLELLSNDDEPKDKPNEDKSTEPSIFTKPVCIKEDSTVDAIIFERTTLEEETFANDSKIEVKTDQIEKDVEKPGEAILKDLKVGDKPENEDSEKENQKAGEAVKSDIKTKGDEQDEKDDAKGKHTTAVDKEYILKSSEEVKEDKTFDTKTVLDEQPKNETDKISTEEPKKELTESKNLEIKEKDDTQQKDEHKDHKKDDVAAVPDEKTEFGGKKTEKQDHGLQLDLTSVPSGKFVGELRETHITTVDSPEKENAFIPISEENGLSEGPRSPPSSPVETELHFSAYTIDEKEKVDVVSDSKESDNVSKDSEEVEIKDLKDIISESIVEESSHRIEEKRDSPGKDDVSEPQADSSPAPKSPLEQDAKEETLSKETVSIKEEDKAPVKDKTENDLKEISDEKLNSGKSTPEIKISGEAKAQIEPKSEDLKKLSPNDSVDRRDSSGKASPEQPINLSGRSTPEIKISLDDKSSSSSGKSSPDLNFNGDLNQRITHSSGRSTPEIKITSENLEDVAYNEESFFDENQAFVPPKGDKDDHDSGKTTPEPKSPSINETFESESASLENKSVISIRGEEEKTTAHETLGKEDKDNENFKRLQDSAKQVKEEAENEARESIMDKSESKDDLASEKHTAEKSNEQEIDEDFGIELESATSQLSPDALKRSSEALEKLHGIEDHEEIFESAAKADKPSTESPASEKEVDKSQEAKSSKGIIGSLTESIGESMKIIKDSIKDSKDVLDKSLVDAKKSKDSDGVFESIQKEILSFDSKGEEEKKDITDVKGMTSQFLEDCKEFASTTSTSSQPVTDLKDHAVSDEVAFEMCGKTPEKQPSVDVSEETQFLNGYEKADVEKFVETSASGSKEEICKKEDKNASFSESAAPSHFGHADDKHVGVTSFSEQLSEKIDETKESTVNVAKAAKDLKESVAELKEEVSAGIKGTFTSAFSGFKSIFGAGEQKVKETVKQVEEVSGALSKQVKDTKGKAEESVVKATENIDQFVQRQGDEALAFVEEKTSAYEKSAKEAMEKVKDSTSTVSTAVVEELSSAKSDALGMIHDLQDKAKVSTDKLAEELHEKKDQLEGFIQKTQDETASVIKGRTSEIESGLKKTAGEINEIASTLTSTAREEVLNAETKASETAQDAQDKYQTFVKEVKEEMRESGKNLEEFVVSKDREATVYLQEKASSFEADVKKTTDDVKSIFGGISSSLKDQFHSVEEHAKQTASGFKEQYEKSIRDIQEGIKESSKKIDDSLNSKDTEASEYFKEQLNTFETHADDAKNSYGEVSSSLKDNFHTVGEQMSSVTNDFKRKYETSVKDIKDEVSKSTEVVKELIKSKEEEASNYLKDNITTLENEAKKTIDTAKDIFGNVSTSIKDDFTSAGDHIETTVHELKSQYDTTMKDIKEEIKESNKKVEEMIKSKENEASTNLRESITSFETEVKKTVEGAKDAFSTVSSSIRDELHSTEEKISEVAHDFEQKCHTTEKDFKGEIKDSSKSIGQFVASKEEEASEYIKEKSSSFETGAKTAVSDVSRSLQEELQTAESKIAHDLEGSFKAAQGLMSKMGEELYESEKKLESSVEKVEHETLTYLEKKSSDIESSLTKSLETTLSTITTTIEDSTQKLSHDMEDKYKKSLQDVQEFVKDKSEVLHDISGKVGSALTSGLQSFKKDAAESTTSKHQDSKDFSLDTLKESSEALEKFDQELKKISKTEYFSDTSTPVTPKDFDEFKQELYKVEEKPEQEEGSKTPPTIPVSPNVAKSEISEAQQKKEVFASLKTTDHRSSTPGSDDCEPGGVCSPHSDISSGQMSRVANPWGGSSEERHIFSDDDDVPSSPLSATSQVPQTPPSNLSYQISEEMDVQPNDDELLEKIYYQDPMHTSFYGALPDDDDDEEEDELRHFERSTRRDYVAEGRFLEEDPSPCHQYELTTARFAIGAQSSRRSPSPIPLRRDVISSGTTGPDPTASWGQPLGLPSPAPPNGTDNSSNKTTPKKERRVPVVAAKNKINDDRKRSESPSKYDKRFVKKISPVYVDLTYVPHHGNSYYAFVDFFKRVRARYYVFSGTEPSKDVYNALLEAKQTWEDKELEVTIIPTYDTDVLGYWVTENEDLLAKYKIDLSPSASRCTINLQDHDTSCSAYRLEF